MNEYILYLNIFVIFNIFLIIISTLGGNKFDYKANIYFVIFLVISLRQLVANLMIQYFKISTFVFSEVSLGGINLIIGPVIFQYVFVLTEQKMPKNWYLHFAPALGFFLYGLNYLFLPKETEITYFNEIKLGVHLPVLILNYLILLHTIVYFIVIKKAFKKIIFESNHPRFMSLMLKKKWANQLVNYLIVCNIIVFFAYIITLVGFSFDIMMVELVVLPLILLSIYSFIIFKNFKFSAIYDNVATLNNPNSIPTKPPINSQESQQMADLWVKIEEHIQNNKTYINPDIGLQKLADELQVSAALLSKTMNYHDISFTEYINQKRVDEAKYLLISEKNQHLKIEVIGEMAGFNSRSTFYLVFKKYTGMTPIAFKSMK